MRIKRKCQILIENLTFFNFGAGDGTRTRNLLITSQLLCQLSYTGKYGDLEGTRTLDL